MNVVGIHPLLAAIRLEELLLLCAPVNVQVAQQARGCAGVTPDSNSKKSAQTARHVGSRTGRRLEEKTVLHGPGS